MVFSFNFIFGGLLSQLPKINSIKIPWVINRKVQRDTDELSPMKDKHLKLANSLSTHVVLVPVFRYLTAFATIYMLCLTSLLRLALFLGAKNHTISLIALKLHVLSLLTPIFIEHFWSCAAKNGNFLKRDTTTSLHAKLRRISCRWLLSAVKMEMKKNFKKKSTLLIELFSRILTRESRFQLLFLILSLSTMRCRARNLILCEKLHHVARKKRRQERTRHKTYWRNKI